MDNCHCCQPNKILASGQREFVHARAHDDEEDRMTFQSHNPATGELIGTYPEHDEAETNVRLQRAWEGRKECSPEHDAGDKCHHPFHEAASPFLDPGVMSAGYLH